MKIKKIILPVLLTALYLFNCASRGEVKKFKNDIIQIQRQLNSIENAVETKLSAMDQSLGETNLQLKEELDFLRQIRAEINTKIASLEEKVQIVDSKLADAGVSGDRRRANIQRSPSITAKEEEKPSIDDNINAEQIFNNARVDYTKENYTLAIEGFKEFLRKYPQNEYVGEAQFWLADCYYNQGKFLEAITEFEKVLKDHSTSPKVPASMLKLGLSYIKLNEYSNARTYLNEVIRKHPNSQEARVAQDQLDSLPGNK